MIVWLASYPKSGNTWARLLLSAYHYDGPAKINNMIGTGDAHRMMYQASSIRPVTLMSLHEHVLLRPAALLNMLYMTPQKPALVKTHHANSEIFGVRMIPPYLTNAAIYIVRDPRDVAVSMARHMGKKIDESIDNMASEEYNIGGGDEIMHLLSTWSNHVKSWGNGDPETTLIKYEDMRSDTADALERMLLTCGIKPNVERIERAVEACRLERIEAEEEMLGFSEASSHTGKFFGVGKGWENELSHEQVTRIQNDHGDMMKELGYPRHIYADVPRAALGLELTGT